jgi:TonB family protein
MTASRSWLFRWCALACLWLHTTALVAQPAVPPPTADAAAPTATDGDGVTPPKLVHFQPAPYPEAALAVGLTGSVVLRLTVEADGSVSAAEIAEASDETFAEPARVAALAFRFEPASKGGQPLRVRILYEYRFTLDAAAAAPQQAAPSVGKLSGKLLVAGAETPLAGARVSVTGSDGRTSELTTGPQGEWSLDALAPGAYQVRVQAPGMQAIAISEEVVAGEETLVTYRAGPESDVLEVTVKGQRPPREVTRRTIERREVERVPGTSGDALRSLQSLPGLARPPGLAGLLIVRGSAPEDTETFVDGNNVPIIYHFGGLSSVVPTELLDRIDFYPGNFSARYGRVMGGIVDVGLRSPNTDCLGDYGKPSGESGCYRGLLQVDMIDTRALVSGPIGSSKEWSFAVAGRRSWVDAWLTPVLEEAGAGVTSAPVYYDYQVIADYQPSKNERLSLRFFGSDDRLEIIINDPLAQDPGIVGGNLTFHTAFYRAQAVYETELTSEVELSTSVAVGLDKLEFTLGQLAFNLQGRPILSRSELRFEPTQGVKLDIGLDYQAAPYSILVRAPEPPRPGESSPGPFSTRPIREQQEEGLVFRPAW